MHSGLIKYGLRNRYGKLQITDYIRHHSYIYHAFSEIEFTFNYWSNLTTEHLTNDRTPGISYRYDCAKKSTS